MKKYIIFLFITISGFLYACSTSPYLKETELPKNIKYYSVDKQFKVKPEWYWRLRPEIKSVNASTNIVKYQYLMDKSGIGTVIGETINDNETFFIVSWSNYGYFFIRKEDYNFAEKFKKWLVPLDYVKEYTTRHYINPSDFFSSLNGRSFTLTNAFIFLQSEIFSKHAFLTPGVKQYCNGGYCSNKFLQIPGGCPLFLEFCENKDINYHLAQFAVLEGKDFEYTDTYGQVFIGKKYVAVYVILQWGEVYYALPYEPFSKNDGIEFNAE